MKFVLRIDSMKRVRIPFLRPSLPFLEKFRFLKMRFRNAISLGGDSDTLAAITGSIAEAAYGIPDWIKDKAYTYLDELLKDVLSRWEQEVSIT